LPNHGEQNLIYDPSYGLTHANLQAWEVGSVEAYAYHYDFNGSGRFDQGDKTATLVEGSPPPANQADQSTVRNTEFYSI